MLFRPNFNKSKNSNGSHSINDKFNMPLNPNEKAEEIIKDSVRVINSSNIEKNLSEIHSFESSLEVLAISQDKNSQSTNQPLNEKRNLITKNTKTVSLVSLFTSQYNNIGQPRE